MKYDLIELCCGLGAVTWAAVGAPPPVVSRIGSKRGYTGPILSALGIEPGMAKHVLMVDSDLAIFSVILALTNDRLRKITVEDIEAAARKRNPKKVWQQAARFKILVASAWLLFTAGARGGVGGFKGAHKLRPSVDGFIPSRRALAKRLQEFQVPAKVEALCTDVWNMDPESYEPTVVFADPPYPSRTGYGDNPRDEWCVEDVERLGKKWRAAGHRIVISLDRPLSAASSSRDITKLRKGQTRRSMTKDSVEWLSVFEP